MIFDVHAHLDQIENLDLALTNAKEAGLSGIVAVSMDLPSCQRNLEIKQQSANIPIYLGMGIHPSEADLVELPECLNFAREQKKYLHAIGEIGLDFWYPWVKKDPGKKEEQRKVFRSFLELARALDLPVIIHSRGAWREALETTRACQVAKAIFHWYSGPVDVLNDIIQAGYFVSTTPALAYSSQLREAMLHAPIEQTLIETDSPVFFRMTNEEGFRAEPRDVIKTLKAYCALKNIAEDKARDIFYQNTTRFFGLI
jgi:TatD DNase family protein